jgi:hypothetical protein
MPDYHLKKPLQVIVCVSSVAAVISWWQCTKSIA